ncbi:ATP-binding protein [Agromyces sp. NPDC004153]
MGEIESVRGGVLSIKLASSAALVMVAGETHRVGQVGAFLRIPVGYADLYAITTQVGASSLGPGVMENAGLESQDARLEGFRWVSAALFGESIAGRFERGVGQYPTVGDEVHIVTSSDLDVIYSADLGRDDLTIGRIASSAGIPAKLRLSALVSRHSAVLGSTGSGKSNLVGVALEELASGFPSARILVVDPHGEYGNVARKKTHLIQVGAGDGSLHVPFWALPLDELLQLVMGQIQPNIVEQIRDRVRELKVEACDGLEGAPPPEAVTADSPVPFSIRRLWFELERDERITFRESNNQNDETAYAATTDGDPATLIPPRYPPATSYNTAPYPNRARRNIGKQLDTLRSRLMDAQYRFMFDPDHATSPDLSGEIEADLDSLISEWIGGPKPITVLDVSGVPPEALTTVIGTLLRVVYDSLFWAAGLDVGGRAQPLLVVIDEAHLFLPTGTDSPAHRIISRIAKEGRKYGVGLMLVSQRPSDLDANALSQCGTTIALRLTNSDDRAAVTSSIHDDLAGLTDMLPSLRTGEAIVLGDALQVPSRVRVRSARTKPRGDDPSLPAGWLGERPTTDGYKTALRNWRWRSTEDNEEERDTDAT